MAAFGDVFGLGFALEGFSFFVEAISIAIYVCPVVIEASTGRTTRASSVPHRPVSPARPPVTDTIRHELSAGLRLRHWPDLP